MPNKQKEPINAKTSKKNCVNVMQQCGTIYRVGKSRASDDERLDSFETCRADKKTAE